MAEISTMYGDMEKRLKQAVRASNAIVGHLETVMLIKQAITYDDLIAAQELWNELEIDTQRSLITAHTKGGAFLAHERSAIQGFWTMTVEEYEG